MDTAVVAALIAALGGLALGVFNTREARRSRLEEQQHQAKAELARYRKPLLEAAYDLGARIDNLQNRGFDTYIRSGDRRDVAVLSTLYRFALYFGTLEILRSQLTFLDFEDAEETRSTALQIVEVAETLSSDSYDELMLWREEQRAIGEETLLRERDGTLSCVGFATFVNEFEQRTGPWFQRFQAELQKGGLASGSRRLRAVQAALFGLIRQLDEEKRYNELLWLAEWSQNS
ncbi:MAG TPA: hypothetical protein VG448_02065 [Solirubrobacterales bacterium]|nr:hypothetical protein [Solirubrobacterales bacterium]